MVRSKSIIPVGDTQKFAKPLDHCGVGRESCQTSTEPDACERGGEGRGTKWEELETVVQVLESLCC